MENYYKNEEIILRAWPEWNRFLRISISFIDKAYRSGIQFDPKFNVVHWAISVIGLCKEIAYSYCWLKAYEKKYKNENTPNSLPAHVDFRVGYFSDNCITRIDSCRDKIALMVWSYFCNFNPEKRNEVLDFKSVYDRMKFPKKYGLKWKNPEKFLKILEKLNDSRFNRIERYRNLKIHRLEPRIEIYGVKKHHGWPYMIPLYAKDEIKRFEIDLKKKVTKHHSLEKLKEECTFDGVLYDHRKIKDSIWNYEEVSKLIETWLKILSSCTADCLEILKKRSPLRLSN